MPKILEIACFNLESALLAQTAGADRIELCENYREGGISPDQTLISEARQKIQIPIHVLIRPNGGNFVYTPSEIEEMKKTIVFCKKNKINGVVFGILTRDFKIDQILSGQMITLAKPMQVTFHRAIDKCLDIKSELRKLIALGCNSVLSSGGKTTALEGEGILKELQNEFGKSINIIPGGGIRSSNITRIREITQCNEFHSAAITNHSDMADLNEIKALKKLLI